MPGQHLGRKAPPCPPASQLSSPQSNCPSLVGQERAWLLAPAELSTLSIPTEWGVPRALRLLQKILSDPRSRDVVQMADALFVQRDLPLVPTFMLRFQRLFHQMVKQVDFSESGRARDIVNAWVKQHTNGEQQQRAPSENQANSTLGPQAEKAGWGA